MIEIRTIFTEEQIIKFLRENNFEVRKGFKQHEVGKDRWESSMWEIKNCLTGRWDDAIDVFKRIVEKRQTDFYMQPLSKFEIINTLNK